MCACVLRYDGAAGLRVLSLSTCGFLAAASTARLPHTGAGRTIEPMSTSLPDPLGTPGAPSAPAGPATESQQSVGVLERTEERLSHGDEERFSHYVRKDRLMASTVYGQPVVALCGKIWIPSRNPDRYPVCPTCKEIRKQMGNQGSGWPFGPDVPGSGK